MTPDQKTSSDSESVSESSGSKYRCLFAGGFA